MAAKQRPYFLRRRRTAAHMQHTISARFTQRVLPVWSQIQKRAAIGMRGRWKAVSRKLWQVIPLGSEEKPNKPMKPTPESFALLSCRSSGAAYRQRYVAGGLMSARVSSCVWLLFLVFVMPAWSQEPVRAVFSHEDAKVHFWQTNHLSGGQGTCVVRFGFDGTALRAPIENLTLTIRVLDKNGVDLGTVDLVLLQPLGPPMVTRYGEALFEGVQKWPLQDDGELSPLCYEGTTLVVESAVGGQSGKIVDLIRFGQLEFTAFPRLNVKVKN